jgi:cobalamin biosynthesis protein CbiD
LTQTGCDKEILVKCRDANTAEAQIQELTNRNKLGVFNEVAKEIEKAVSKFMGTDINTGVVLFSMAGDVIGVSKGAKRWLFHTN